MIAVVLAIAAGRGIIREQWHRLGIVIDGRRILGFAVAAAATVSVGGAGHQDGSRHEQEREQEPRDFHDALHRMNEASPAGVFCAKSAGSPPVI
jgi:hypothetical protein